MKTLLYAFLARINYIPQNSLSFYISVSVNYKGDCLWELEGKGEVVTILQNSLVSDLPGQPVVMKQQLCLCLFSFFWISLSFSDSWVVYLCSVSSERVQDPAVYPCYQGQRENLQKAKDQCLQGLRMGEDHKQTSE